MIFSKGTWQESDADEANELSFQAASILSIKYPHESETTIDYKI